MALHELATNAAKYGALSAIGRSIEISWDIAPSGSEIQLKKPHREPPTSKRPALASHRSLFVVKVEALASQSLVLQLSRHLTKLLRGREIKSLA
jgi:two-component sensor histidine kinase